MIWTKFSDKSGWYDSGPKGETVVGIFAEESDAEEFLQECGFKFKRKQVGEDEKTGSSVWHAEILKLHTLTDIPQNLHPVFPRLKFPT